MEWYTHEHQLSLPTYRMKKENIEKDQDTHQNIAKQ